MKEQYLTLIQQLACENGRYKYRLEVLEQENKTLKDQLQSKKPPATHQLNLHQLSSVQLN